MSKFTITLNEAKDWANKWQTNPPKDLAKAHLKPREALTELLATEEVVNIRAYMGVDGTGAQKLMFVGVNADGKDLIDDNHLIYDKTEPCPNNCDSTSPLYNP